MPMYLLTESDHTALMNMLDWWRSRGQDQSEQNVSRWTSSIVDQYQRPIFLGKTTASHSKGATQAVDLYGKSNDTVGSETKLTLGNGEDSEVDCYNRFADLEDDKWVFAVPVNLGYELIAAEC